MSRALVDTRAPAMFNLFSSACKRRSISPASANWPNLTSPKSQMSFYEMKFRAWETSARCSLFQGV